MSMKLMVEAMNTKVGNSGRKLVLLKLADHANDKCECWPSYQHIADACEMGRSTVKAHIKQLVSEGLLKMSARNDGKSSNMYIITLKSQDSTRSKSDPVKNKPGQKTNGTRSKSDPPTRSESDPRTSHSFEPVIEPHTGSAKADPKSSGEDKKKGQGPVLLKTYLENLKQCGQEKPFRDNDPIFDYAESIDLPKDFLAICWFEFKDRHIHSNKKYRDWHATFRNCVRGNWFKLWWLNHEHGGYQLTTTGEQAKRNMEAKKAA